MLEFRIATAWDHQMEKKRQSSVDLLGSNKVMVTAKTQVGGADW